MVVAAAKAADRSDQSDLSDQSDIVCAHNRRVPYNTIPFATFACGKYFTPSLYIHRCAPEGIAICRDSAFHYSVPIELRVFIAVFAFEFARRVRVIACSFSTQP